MAALRSYGKIVPAVVLLLSARGLAEPKVASTLLSPTRSFYLFGDRLTIKFPEAAFSSDRPVRPGAPRSRASVRETRIELPLPDGQLILYASETYTLADRSIEAIAKDPDLDPQIDAHPQVERFGDVRILRKNPQRWVEVTQGGDLIEDAWAVLPDQTVVHVEYWATPTVEDKSALQALARASLTTIRFQHKLVTGGPVQLEGLAVDLPAGWVPTKQGGTDYPTYHIRKLRRMGEWAGTVAVERAGHPQLFAADQTESGSWLGRKVTWRMSGPGTARQYETVLEVEPGSHDVWHVWCTGNDGWAILNSMTVASAAAPASGH
jgi:hypothetical protein